MGIRDEAGNLPDIRDITASISACLDLPLAMLALPCSLLVTPLQLEAVRDGEASFSFNATRSGDYTIQASFSEALEFKQF